MKNKGLIATLIVLGVVLVGAFAFEMGQKKSEEPAAADESKTEMKTLGVLQFVSHPALDTIYQGVLDGLKENGFEEGKNLKMEYQNGQADQSKLATMSEQLVNEKADVLVGIATPAVQAIANTTKDIPIVMGAVTDPSSAGLVQDLEKPEGNITGVSDKAPADKQILLGTQLLPDAKTVGMLYSSTEDNSKYQVEEAKKAAEELGLTVKEYAVPSSNEIAQTVQVMSEQVDFIYIPLDNTIANAMPTVVNEANKTKTAIITSVDTMVEQGGLATVGVNQYDLGVKTGEMAAKLLKGEATVADLPVYTFTEGETIINTEQAKLLGIKIPADILQEATEVGGEEE